MWKKILIFIFLALISSLLYMEFKTEPKKVHYHAGFLVYKDDLLQDFSGVQYITVAPCTNEEGHKEKNTQLNRGHLHSQIGDVVHVHAEGAKWSDLFKNLKFSTQGGVIAFIDGKQISYPLYSPIKSYQSAIFYFGKHDLNFKPDKKSITIGHIKEVEKTSVECGD